VTIDYDRCETYGLGIAMSTGLAQTVFACEDMVSDCRWIQSQYAVLFGEPRPPVIADNVTTCVPVVTCLPRNWFRA
jgi:hypothetical protein